MRLPDTVKLHFISNEEECVELECLLGKNYIGVDTEWRAAVGVGDDPNNHGGPAIIQISSDEDAFIVDLIALSSC